MGRGALKRQSFEVLRARSVPVETVLDVGVLLGTPELSEFYSDKLHVLFEPVVEFREAIECHYARVPHRLVQAAVSHRSGTTALSTDAAFQGFAISHARMTSEAPDTAQRSVPMVSLDDYLRENPAPPPYFLKIDVDGAELDVLRGATATLRQSSIVMVEVTAGDIIDRLSVLRDAGFRLFDLTEPCYYDSALWQCDAIAIREDVFAAHFGVIRATFDPDKDSVFTR